MTILRPNARGGSRFAAALRKTHERFGGQLWCSDGPSSTLKGRWMGGMAEGALVQQAAAKYLERRLGRESACACAPVSNAFHVLQTLSWIASRRPNVEDRIEMARAVPRLMEGLLSGR